MRIFAVAFIISLSLSNFVSADTIRGIDIDFVTIGHAGNAGDTRIQEGYEGSYFTLANPYGCGAVGYNYRIGKYEVSNAQWNAFVAAAGPMSVGSTSILFTDVQQPVNAVNWYASVQFCNYLTSGDKSKGVYQFSGDNTNPGSFLGIDREAAKVAYGTIYFLPTEDEWYKAAYYKPDGSGYSTFANGQETIPTADNGWNYHGGSYDPPWNVGTGTQEQNGTFDMMGNVQEWTETLSVYERIVRGGSFSDNGGPSLSSLQRRNMGPDGKNIQTGFRVASIPEPATMLLLGLGGMVLRAKNGKRKA